MKKIIELNTDFSSSTAVHSGKSKEELPIPEDGGQFQAVIVHADHMETIEVFLSLQDLKDKLYEDRLIEARFFNDHEEHRILRVTQNGIFKFLYRHLKDGVNEGTCIYRHSADTTADYYKGGGFVLTIRNYIKKRGLLNSYDDMRFVKLEKKKNK